MKLLKCFFIIPLLGLITSTLMANPFFVTSAQAEPAISVSGQAEINVVPDEVVIQVGVESRDKVLSIARKQNDEIVARVLAVTQKLGIESKHVQTGYINIQPIFDESVRGDGTSILRYEIRKEVMVTLSDLSKFETLLTAMLDAGANQIKGIQFKTNELRKHRDRARQLAIIAAREKAQALSGELGQKIGKALSISESDGGGGYFWNSQVLSNVAQNAFNQQADTGGEGNTTLALGQIKVSATVNVTFELQ